MDSKIIHTPGRVVYVCGDSAVDSHICLHKVFVRYIQTILYVPDKDSPYVYCFCFAPTTERPQKASVVFVL